jgi:hypothetical protein
LNTNSTLQVEVLNGCGVEGLCDSITHLLRKNKIDVIHSGNYSSFNVSSTVVVDRIGSRQNMIKLASIINLDTTYIVELINRDYLLDATIILGKDFNKLFPLTRGSN